MRFGASPAAASVCVLIALSAHLGARAQEQFQAASIKRSAIRDLTQVVPPMFLPNGQWSARGVTLSLLLRSAYGLPADRIVGTLPSWALSERFDILTTPSPNTPVPSLQAMAQRLLSERFGLRTRWEQRVIEGHALVRVDPSARLGTGIRPSARECDRAKGSDGLAADDPCKESVVPRESGTRALHLRDRPSTHFITISGASSYVGGAVSDKTGLTGRFDIDLEYIAFPPSTGPRPEFSVPFDVALERELGLRLVREREPVDVLVIERVERLSEN